MTYYVLFFIHLESRRGSESELRAGVLRLAVVEEMMGEYEQAISHILQAMRLSPRDFLLGPWLAQRGRDHFGLHRYDAAIQDELNHSTPVIAHSSHVGVGWRLCGERR